MKSWCLNSAPTAQFTQFVQPVSFADDAADSTRIHIPHELPEQRTEGRLGRYQLLQTGDADTDGLLCWSVLQSTKKNDRRMSFTKGRRF